MRQYPRLLYKGKSESLSVRNENEEVKASIDGFESHWNPEINEKQKGTDKEVLREVEIEEPITEEVVEETEEVEEELIDPVTEEVVEIVKVKRKRRTRAEMEADKK